ncbi:unnamed protein product, partial [Medioppia subpectinata]
VYNGNIPVLVVAEPELVKQICVKDFHVFPDRNRNRVVHPILGKHLVTVCGDDWKRIRSIVTPTFSSSKMKNMFPMIRNCLQNFINELEVLAIDGKEVNVKTLYGQYTMDVISTCAFATKTNTYKDPNDPIFFIFPELNVGVTIDRIRFQSSPLSATKWRLRIGCLLVLVLRSVKTLKSFTQICFMSSGSATISTGLFPE